MACVSNLVFLGDSLLLFLAAVHCCHAFPSFRDRIPNGRRVPCPEGTDGGEVGDALECQPQQVCNGVGHNSCIGGSMPLNAFGEALQQSGFVWTLELCQADSDGDGLTNGQELGDPCCSWQQSDIPSKYTQAFSPTHPGFKTDVEVVSAYEQPNCDLATPEKKGVILGQFNPGEDQHVVEMRIDNFAIPPERTTYVDIALNFPDSIFNRSADIFHVVLGEAIVDQKDYLHHFVLRACSERFPDEMHGKALDASFKVTNCNIGFGGWAPGKRIFDLPPWAGQSFGPGANIVAIFVSVHYDNQNGKDGVVDSSGLRFRYTQTLRDHSLESIPILSIGINPSMIVPPGEKRWFLTRRCKLSITNTLTQVPAEMHVLGVTYHAHLLGREMYTEIFRSGELPLSLGSERRWHFDDQGMTNVYNANVSLRSGDVIQSTCVMDSSGRDSETVFGKETIDEMCWASFTGWSDDGDGISSECNGNIWSGMLADQETPFGLAERHPFSLAPGVWDGSKLVSGGSKIMEDGKQLTLTCTDLLPARRCKLILGQGSGKELCNANLGDFNALFEGKDATDLCCLSACIASDGMCQDNQRCKDKLAAAAEAEADGDTSSAVVWPAVYKMRVSSCSDDADGFMTLDIVAPAVQKIITTPVTTPAVPKIITTSVTTPVVPKIITTSSGVMPMSHSTRAFIGILATLPLVAL